ncbi:MAG: RNA polymerase sigma factor [Gemmatimonadales bacterium]
MNVTDGEVVRRVLGGDAEAYAVLVARYRDRLGRYAIRMLGNVQDSEEVLQDTFLRAYRSLRNCHDPELFGRWLFKILVNRCRTVGATRGRRERLFVGDEVALQNAANYPVDGYVWREEIERALNELPSEQREAFLLKHVEDLRYEEIAEITGVGISALKMRVNRACARMRGLLDGVYRE